MEPQAVGDFLVASRAAVRQAGELLVQYSFSIVGALILLVVGWIVARLVHRWVESVGLESASYGTHWLRPTKATQIYRKTGNLRAVQLLLGHTKLESTF